MSAPQGVDDELSDEGDARAAGLSVEDRERIEDWSSLMLRALREGLPVRLALAATAAALETYVDEDARLEIESLAPRESGVRLTPAPAHPGRGRRHQVPAVGAAYGSSVVVGVARRSSRRADLWIDLRCACGYLYEISEQGLRRTPERECKPSHRTGPP